MSFLGSIRDKVVEIEDIYYEFIQYLIRNNMQKTLFEEFEINENEEDFEEISKIIAKKRGFLQKVEIDYFKLANAVLNDFRNGKYGKVQLDNVR